MDIPEQSSKLEPPATQRAPPILAPSPSVALNDDEQDIDLQTILSKPFPRFNRSSIHEEYDDVAVKQTRFEEGALTFLLVSTRFKLKLVATEIEGKLRYV